MTDGKPVVLAVDDDPGVLSSIRRLLSREGFQVHTATRPGEALALLEELRPDALLLDVVMPEMSGYDLCSQVLSRDRMSHLPVIFVTVLGEEEDRARAFAAGAADVIVKPFSVEELVETVRGHVRTGSRLGRNGARTSGDAESMSPTHPSAWKGFKAYLAEVLVPGPEARAALDGAASRDLPTLADALEVGERALARYVADFLEVPFVSGLAPEDVEPGLLPPPYCQANLVVPVRLAEGVGVVMANPFDWEVLESVRSVLPGGVEPEIVIAEPGSIRAFFTYGEGGDEASAQEFAALTGQILNADQSPDDDAGDGGPGETGGHPVLGLANEMLRRAVSERASDIHLEPKDDYALIRFRVDGDLRDVRRISRELGARAIARFKALGEMDIAEKRKPQDGAMGAVIHGRQFKLRLATAATPHGESIVIRMLEPLAEPTSLEDLGMSYRQAETLRDMAGRSHGLILVVGPTGSGKSTTIFSLLSRVDGKRRSIITVEDPVEYRIPLANQQQVHERAGVTFESLLKSAVRQDPDILLLGEIRDLFSAKASLDFASSGHLTVTTLHSSNATTAVFRLERLGVERGAMADAVLGVVAQKLLKRLCRECREARPITAEEREMLAPHTDQVPDRVAHPVGCPACHDTGYRGREGVYEILRFDPAIQARVREGASIAELRLFARDRGDFLISRHAVEKVRALTFSPRDIFEQVLAEEVVSPEPVPPEPAPPEPAPSLPGDPEPARREIRAGEVGSQGSDPALAEPVATGTSASPPDRNGSTGSVLVVEDDLDTRALLDRFLEGAGYDVVLAEDGADALLKLGRESFDVVLSDINMPNLDGLKLLEILVQQGVETPVIFLTAQTGEEYEVKGLELGAADFLVKPVKKDVLRLRLGRILSQRA